MIKQEKQSQASKARRHHSKLERQMGIIPEHGFMRLKQVLSVLPIGKTTWYTGIKAGKYPKPVCLSARSVAWRCEDIHALIEKLGGQS